MTKSEADAFDAWWVKAEFSGSDIVAAEAAWMAALRFAEKQRSKDAACSKT